MKKRNRGGFSLVEVILSIAVLALLSGFILQFFITSSRLNERSSQVDQATVLAASAVENFKAQETPALAAEGELAQATVTAGSGGWEATQYYDQDWRPLAPGAGGETFRLCATVTPVAEGKALTVSSDGSGEARAQSGLYRIEVRVETLQPGEGSGVLANPELIAFTAQRYFAWTEGGAR